MGAVSTTSPDRVVVVGAGLGGLRAAEQLRTAGYTGEVVVLGDEPHLPYNRPPLSKEGLAAGLDHETVAFRRKASVDDVLWRLGGAQNTVTRADLAAHVLQLADGSTLGYDGLVMATGVSARRLPLDAPLQWRHVSAPLTTRRPCARASPRDRGWWSSAPGSSAARSLRPPRMLGCAVDVVDPMPVPLVRPLGAELGAEIQRRHEEQGVRFHLGRTVARIDGTTTPGRPRSRWTTAPTSRPPSSWRRSVRCPTSAGSRATAWTCPTACCATTGCARIGAGGPLPATRSPSATSRASPTRCSTTCRAGSSTGTSRPRPPSAPPVLAADLAARAAGHDTGVDPDPIDALGEYTPMPAFWSDQYEMRLQSFGLPGLGRRRHPAARGRADRRVRGRLPPRRRAGRRGAPRPGPALLALPRPHRRARRSTV